MKAICLPVFNRPEMLQQTFEGILRNNPQGWMVFVSLEHGAPKRCEELCAIYSEKMAMMIRPNRWHLDCSLNSFVACQMAIRSNAEAILFMDDDILLSPDALNLCEWYLNREMAPDDMGIALCRREGNDPTRPGSISATDTHMGHLGQGWCFTRKMWFDWVLRYWWSREDGQPDCYDWALCLAAQVQKKTILRPRFARAQHAAAVGYHGPGIGIFPDQISDGKCRSYKIEP